MRSAAIFAVLVLTAAMLAACELYLGLDLFNNTGAPITVLTGTAPLSIAASEAREFHYPDNLEAWTFRISDGQCEYRYQVPKSLDHYPSQSYGHPIKAQVERDFSIYLIPPDAKNVSDVAALASQQVDGFPLHPLSRTCR